MSVHYKIDVEAGFFYSETSVFIRVILDHLISAYSFDDDECSQSYVH